jgi:RHS repeat-associated protein
MNNYNKYYRQNLLLIMFLGVFLISNFFGFVVHAEGNKELSRSSLTDAYSKNDFKKTEIKELDKSVDIIDSINSSNTINTSTVKTVEPTELKIEEKTYTEENKIETAIKPTTEQNPSTELTPETENTRESFGNFGIDPHFKDPVPDKLLEQFNNLEGAIGEAGVDNFTGAATYNYPISLPKGRNGLNPSLALTYNSHNRDTGNLLGYGWNLIQSSIYRFPKNGVDVMYNQNDFKLNLFGSECKLIPLQNEDYGSYECEIKRGFLKVDYLNNNTWEVRDKSGTVYKYGLTTDERQDDPNDNARVYKWMLTEIKDLSDNYIRYEYLKDSGQIYPKAIYYTGHGETSSHNDGIFEVRFEPFYSENLSQRLDHIKKYNTGFAVDNKYLLESVEIYTEDVLRKKYLLTHELGAESIHSVLTSIQLESFDEDGNNGYLSPAVGFSYRGIEGYFQQESSWENGENPVMMEDYGQDGGVRIGDLNGDGNVDLIKTVESLDTRESVYQFYKNEGDSFNDYSGDYIPPFIKLEGSMVFDKGSRLVDLNGDGKLDVIRGDDEENEKEVYINSNLSFSQDDTWSNSDFPYFSAENNEDLGSRIVDVDGDGLPDIIQSRNNSETVYINNGDSFSQDATWSNSDIPEFVDDGVDQGARFLDINGDGLQDIIKRSSGDDLEVYINKGESFEYSIQWSNNPTIPSFARFNGEDNGTRILDINSDGLPDIIEGDDGMFQVYVNMGNYLYDGSGSGWDTPDTGLSFIYNGEDQGLRVVDLNRDGLPDLIHGTIRDGQEIDRIYLNNGFEFDNSANWGNFPPFSNTDDNGKDLGVRLIDLNGDGAIDIYKSTETEIDVRLNTVKVPDLLVTVDNGRGGDINIEYKTEKVQAHKTGGFSSKFPMEVVDTITISSSTIEEAVTSYNYYGGYYHFEKYNDKDFRGFNKVETINHDGTVIANYYYQGGNVDGSSHGELEDHFAKKGNIYRRDIRNADNILLSKSLFLWDLEEYESDYGNRYFPYLRDQVQFSYDEHGSASKETASHKEYNFDYGEVITAIEFGEINSSGNGDYMDLGEDLRKVVFEDFIYDEATNLLKVGIKNIYGYDNELFISEKYYYDNENYGQLGNRGLLTRTEIIDPSADFVESNMSYDNYGNIVLSEDANGNETSYVYDEHNIYPVEVENALGHIEFNTYDYLTGQVLNKIDFNNNTTTSVLDSSGRVIEMYVPSPENNGAEIKILDVEYEDYQTPNYVHIEINDSSAGDGKYHIYKYYDAFGREIQERSEAEVGQFLVKDTLYDELGRVLRKSLPYYSNSSDYAEANLSAAATTYSYDALDRVVLETNDLGTVEFTYGVWNTRSEDLDGFETSSYYDAFGNIVELREHYLSGGYTSSTQYEYNNLGLLTKITDNDSNIREFEYGLFNRLDSQTDFHIEGDDEFVLRSYTYDNLGNILTDSSGDIVITYSYDGLNRLLTKDDSSTTGIDITYTYDIGDNAIGNISSININSNPPTSYSYSYDELYNVVNKSGEIHGQDFDFDFSYDHLKRLKTIDYGIENLNDYNNDVSVSYFYNDRNLLDSVIKTVNGNTEDILEDLNYNELGLVTEIIYKNGDVVENTYNNNQLYRLSNRSISNTGDLLQSYSYNYTAGGDITEIIDSFDIEEVNYLIDNTSLLGRAINGIAGVITNMFSPVSKDPDREKKLELIKSKEKEIDELTTLFKEPVVSKYDLDDKYLSIGVVKLKPELIETIDYVNRNELGSLVAERINRDAMHTNSFIYFEGHKLAVSLINGYFETYELSLTGNIDYKSDQGNYQYGDNQYASPYAVTQIGEDIFEYDDRGNLVTYRNKVLEYDGFNRLKTVQNQETNVSENYYYDHSEKRVFREIPEKNAETYYIDDLVEIQNTTNGTKVLNHIYAGSELVSDISFEDLLSTSCDTLSFKCFVGPSASVEEINSIISEASDLGSADQYYTVVFSPVTYSLSSPITLLPYVNLSGQEGTVLDGGGSVRLININNLGVNTGELFLLSIENGLSVDGGGIHVENSEPVFKNIKIKANESDNGGGVFIENNSSVEFINSVIINNVSSSLGGGIHVDNSNLNIVNTTIANNEAFSGGSVYNSNSTLDIRNTISVLNSTEVYGNITAINYSLLQDDITGLNGVSNIEYNGNGSDLFVDMSTNDYHLLDNSVAINSGDPDEIYMDPDGTINDMGSFGGPTALIYNLAPSIEILEPSVGANIAGEAYTITWNDEDLDNNAVINFYYDTDNIGEDGTLINAIPVGENYYPNEYIWNVESVDIGEYYVYAVITDGVNTEVVDYSEGTVVVNRVPSIEIVEPDGVDDLVSDQFIIKWNDLDSDDDASISFFYDDDDSGADGIMITSGISEDNELDEYVWNTSEITVGTYYIYGIINDSTNEEVVDYSAGSLEIVDNEAPSIEILEPNGVGDYAYESFNIIWNDSDGDSSASISLYYDTDNQGIDGTLIVTNLSEDDNNNSYNWDVSGLEEGSYYVYAVIDDNINAEVVDYSQGTVTVVTGTQLFGDGSHGDVVITEDIEADSLNNKQYNNLTIAAGVTVTGELMNLKVKEVLTINGTITATGEGREGGGGGIASHLGGYGGYGGTMTTGGNGSGEQGIDGTDGNKRAGGGGGFAYRDSNGDGSHTHGGAGDNDENANNGAGGGGGGAVNNYDDTGANAKAGAGGGAGYGTIGYGGRGGNNGDDGSSIQGGDAGNGDDPHNDVEGGGGGGGGTYGSANFGDDNMELAGSEFYRGSGGGGGGEAIGYDNSSPGRDGGNGGGRIKIAAKEIILNGTIESEGEDGGPHDNHGDATGGGGGGGSGGSIWIITKNADFSNGIVSVAGGLGGTNSRDVFDENNNTETSRYYGGNGGYGRIRIDGNYTGTTNPAPGYHGALPTITNLNISPNPVVINETAVASADISPDDRTIVWSIQGEALNSSINSETGEIAVGDQTGTITIRARDLEYPEIYEEIDLYILEDLSGAPQIEILEPDGIGDSADDTFTITWNDSAANSDAVISLYYDNDNTGQDGIMITSGISEDDETDEFVWDVSGINVGSYYIYGVIDTDYYDPIVDYSSGPLDIVNLPSIIFTNPGVENDTAYGSYLIKWEDEYVDGDASISLFYDTNNWGEDGILIADGISEDDELDQLVWDVSSLELGDYYIYAVIDNEINSPVVVYSDSFVSIISTAPLFGTGADGDLVVHSTTTVTMKEIYENDIVNGITTHRGENRGLNYGVGAYSPDSMGVLGGAIPNFNNVTINSNQKIIGDSNNVYNESGHTYMKVKGLLVVDGIIDEEGDGSRGGAGGDCSVNFGAKSGFTPDGTQDINNGVGSGNNGSKNNGGGGGTSSNSPGNGGLGGNLGSGGAGGAGGNTYYYNELGGHGGGGGYGTPGTRGLGAGFETDGSIGQGGNGGAGSTFTMGGGAGGGGTYGSANFGNANINLAGLEFYIGSGGGGNGGGRNYGGGYCTGQEGSSAGGKIKIFAKQITLNGSINANGLDTIETPVNCEGEGGAGSGGAVWIVSRNANLNVEKVTVNGGASYSSNGGAGGYGRIRIDGNYTGTTSPEPGYHGSLPEISNISVSPNPIQINSTSQATGSITPQDHSIVWSIVGENYGASIESETGVIMTGEEIGLITIRATDSSYSDIYEEIEVEIFVPNNAPVAVDDYYELDEDNVLTVAAENGVLLNDYDVDLDELTASLVTGVSEGILIFNDDGSFEYTPDPNANGDVSFTYMAYDGESFSNPATVVLSVSPLNDPPSIELPDSFEFEEDSDLTVDFSDYISDIDEDNLSLTVLTNGTIDVVIDSLDVSFSAEENWNGSESVIFMVSDSQSRAVDSDMVLLTVTPVNDMPIADDDYYELDEDSLLTVAAENGVLFNDYDIDGDELTASLVAGVSEGILIFNEDGSFEYIPNLNATGDVTFTYKAYDGEYFSTEKTVTLTIGSINDVPEIVIVEPDGINDEAIDSFLITWEDEDIDNDAEISLYYDTDNSGQNGTLIVSGISENSNTDEYIWDTSDVPNGEYYIYGIIDDGVERTSRALSFDYSEGTVSVLNYCNQSSYVCEIPAGSDAEYINQVIIEASTLGSENQYYTVEFDSGTFVLDQQIELKEFVNLQGQGQDQTFLDGNDSVNVLFIYDLHDNAGSILDLTIQNGFYNHFGGGIYNRNSNLNITNLTITDNSGSVFGGGVLNMNSDMTMNNVIVSGNSEGGIANLNDSNLVIKNSLISNNYAADMYGGGIYNSNSSLALENTTIADNFSSWDGGGISSDQNSFIEILNSIIAFNGDSELDIYPDSIEINHSLVTEDIFQFGGTGNIEFTGTADELFSDYDNNEYYLIDGAVAVDAGDPAPEYDDPDGSRNDMGAYGGPDAVRPYNPIATPLAAEITAVDPENPINQNSSHILAEISHPVGVAYTYEWDYPSDDVVLKNSTINDNILDTKFLFCEVGEFDFTIHVTDDYGNITSDTISVESVPQSGPFVAHYRNILCDGGNNTISTRSGGGDSDHTGNEPLSLKIKNTLEDLFSVPSAHAEFQETTTYFHKDYLGGTSIVTDDNGDVVSQQKYLPYGKNYIDSNAANYQNNKKFTGKELDNETGLYYFGYRYYDPEIGRWTSIDPVQWDMIFDKNLQAKVLANPVMHNSYAYAGNNPMRYVDPDGRAHYDLVDIFFFLDSWSEFQDYPGALTGIGLILDTVGLLPGFPAWGGKYIKIQDDAIKFLRKSVEGIMSASKFANGGQEIGRVWSKGKHYATAADDLVGHTLKHANEFQLSKWDVGGYYNKANDFIDNAPYIFKNKEGLDTLYFNPENMYFAITNNAGEIKSFYTATDSNLIKRLGKYMKEDYLDAYTKFKDKFK